MRSHSGWISRDAPVLRRAPVEQRAVEREAPRLDVRDGLPAVLVDALELLDGVDAGRDPLLDVLLILPAPGEVGRHDDVEHVVGGVDADRGAREGRLEVHVPAEEAMLRRRRPELPDRVRLARLHETQHGEPPWLIGDRAAAVGEVDAPERRPDRHPQREQVCAVLGDDVGEAHEDTRPLRHAALGMSDVAQRNMLAGSPGPSHLPPPRSHRRV